MYWMDDRLRMALLKEKNAYREFWKKFGGAEGVIATYREKQEYYEKNPDHIGHVGPDPKCPADKVFHDFIVGLFGSFGIVVTDELTGEALQKNLESLNPYSEELPDPLPFHFRQSPPVTQLVDWNSNTPSEHDYTVPVDVAIKRLQPWERVLRIDLRQKRAKIVEEFGNFLDRIAELRSKPEKRAAQYRITKDCHLVELEWQYDQWETDSSRVHRAARQQLGVWRLRRQRKTFEEVANETGLSADNAKKSFYAAYELIEGKPYDREQFREKYREIETKGRRKPCDNCRACDPLLDIPCPDLLDWLEEIEAYANQDDVPLRENLIGDEKLDFIENQRDMPHRK